MPRNHYFTIRNNNKCVEDELMTNDEKKCDKFWKVRPAVKRIREGCLKNPRSEKVDSDTFGGGGQN